MTASLVQELPVLISKSLNIDIDSVIVVSITGATNTNLKKRAASGSNGVVVAVAIPDENVSELENIIKSPNSTLYSPSNGQLPTFIDRNYPVTNGKSAVNTSNGGATVTDPNGNTSGGSGSNQSGGSSSGGGLPKAGIIGICVGVGVAVYAAATIVGVKVYRKRRAKKDEEIREQHMVFAQSISSPIMQGNSLGWVPAPYQQHQTPRNRQY